MMFYDLALVVIGAIASVSLQYIAMLISFIYRSFKTYYMEGKWYGYYSIYIDGKPALKSNTWIIKKGFNTALSVIIQHPPDIKLSYKGKIYLNRNHIVARIHAIEDAEEVLCRFRLPVPGNDKIMIGFWLGMDFDGKITVGSTVLSRTPLIDEEAKNLVLGAIQIDESIGVMNVK